ncbi:MAG: hypothetical protein ACTSXH_05245 [Promethearchaeota archaeon]
MMRLNYFIYIFTYSLFLFNELDLELDPVETYYFYLVLLGIILLIIILTYILLSSKED